MSKLLKNNQTGEYEFDRITKLEKVDGIEKYFFQIDSYGNLISM